MKKNFFISVTAFSLLLISCSKSNNDVLPPASGADKIKTWVTNGLTMHYSYDNQGRLVQLDYSDGAKKSYAYEQGKIIYKYYDNTGAMVSHKEIFLGADGKVVKELFPLKPGNQITYTYDSDHNLEKYSFQNNITHYYYLYFFSNGNLDSIRRFNANDQWISSSRYTYYTDKKNTLSSDNEGLFFKPHISNNLLKTEENYYADGSTPYSYNYSYEFDDKGRVIKYNVYQSGSVISVQNIIYE